MAKKEALDPATEYQAKMAAAHMRAADIATEVFGDKPTREVINGVFDRVVYLDDDADIEEESTEDAKGDLIGARGWAKDVYGTDDALSTFDAYDRAFDLDEEDEDDDE